MAEFEVKVCEVEIEPIEGADRIEVARVGDFQCITGKGSMSTGDLAAYLPVDSIVPDYILDELGLTGMLSGPNKNRVKPRKFLGVLSEGIIYPVKNGQLRGQDVFLGDDVTELLEVTKFEAPIPTHMKGQLHSRQGKTLRFDVENIKKYPDLFSEDDLVYITEKLHGTFACFGRYNGEEWIVHSKGLGARGIGFKVGDENANNLYVKTFFGIQDSLENLDELVESHTWYICGEIIGLGVQDMHYGEKEPVFVAFDLFEANPDSDNPRDGYYWPLDRFVNAIDECRIFRVPILYAGNYDRSVVDDHTTGNTVWGLHDFKEPIEQIREGVVVRLIAEGKEEVRKHHDIGRMIAKSISPDYLMRKGGTEHN